MIGYTVNSKVKRFIKAQRAKKILVTRTFLNALDAEIERAVVKTVEQTKGDHIHQLVVVVPDKKISDRLVCDQRIKERIKKLKPEASVSKKLLTDINTYTGAIIIASIELIDGVYMKRLAAGSATARVTNRKTVKSAIVTPVGEATANGKSTVLVEPFNYKIEPALPRPDMTS